MVTADGTAGRCNTDAGTMLTDHTMCHGVAGNSNMGTGTNAGGAECNAWGTEATIEYIKHDRDVESLVLPGRRINQVETGNTMQVGSATTTVSADYEPRATVAESHDGELAMGSDTKYTKPPVSDDGAACSWNPGLGYGGRAQVNGYEPMAVMHLQGLGADEVDKFTNLGDALGPRHEIRGAARSRRSAQWRGDGGYALVGGGVSDISPSPRPFRRRLDQLSRRRCPTGRAA